MCLDDSHEYSRRVTPRIMVRELFDALGMVTLFVLILILIGFVPQSGWTP